MSEQHHPTRATYFIVFAALMVLLAATVGASRLWRGPAGVTIAMIIATIKAALVVLYFMHIRYSSSLTRVFVIAGLAWLGILMALTFSDYLTRGWLPISEGWLKQSVMTSRPPQGVEPAQATPQSHERRP